MLGGMVILAHRNPAVSASIERMIIEGLPSVHIEKAERGADVLALQSVMRADAVLVDMNLPDMPGEHLLFELRRDVAKPCIIACSADGSVQARRRAIRAGASEFVTEPVDGKKVMALIENRLGMRTEMRGSGIPEAMLQRIFAEQGVPFDLKGYRYLKYALTLLTAGEAQLEPIRSLYGQIGERFGCMPDAVERNIRYAIGLCRQHQPKDGGKQGNRQFIARLLEESRSALPTLIEPKVSVFRGGQRVFR